MSTPAIFSSLSTSDVLLLTDKNLICLPPTLRPHTDYLSCLLFLDAMIHNRKTRCWWDISHTLSPLSCQLFLAPTMLGMPRRNAMCPAFKVFMVSHGYRLPKKFKSQYRNIIAVMEMWTTQMNPRSMLLNRGLASQAKQSIFFQITQLLVGSHIYHPFYWYQTCPWRSQTLSHPNYLNWKLVTYSVGS